MRISTSPAFGSGTGRVPGTSTSGPPGDLISMTVWVVGILASIDQPFLLAASSALFTFRNRRADGKALLVVLEAPVHPIARKHIAIRIAVGSPATGAVVEVAARVGRAVAPDLCA